MDVPPRSDELILVGFDDPHGVAKEVRRHVAGIKHGRRTVVVSDPQAGYGSGLPQRHGERKAPLHIRDNLALEQRRAKG
jgi:hypothetical protein